MKQIIDMLFGHFYQEYAPENVNRVLRFTSKQANKKWYRKYISAAAIERRARDTLSRTRRKSIPAVSLSGEWFKSAWKMRMLERAAHVHLLRAGYILEYKIYVDGYNYWNTLHVVRA